MAKRTTEHLKSHLSVFEEGYPIQQGYIARLLFVDGCSIPDVVHKVRTIVQTNDPGKDINEASILGHLRRFRDLIVAKRKNLTNQWPSLIPLFLQPLPILFRSHPVASTSSQVGHTSLDPAPPAPVILHSTTSRRTAEHLKSHLSVFEEGYPIQKGYIVRLLFVDGCSVSDVVRKVCTIVQTNDPGKDINEISIDTHVYQLRKLIVAKRKHLTEQWESLITLFLEPFPITFKSPPVVPVSSQPVDTSVPSSSRNPDPPTSLTFEMLLEPGIPVTSMLMQPMQNSTTNNSPSSLLTCKLPSPRKLKSDCTNCVNKQRTIMNVMQKNTYLIQQMKQFKPLFEGKNINFSLTRRLNETIRRKTQSITNWKTRYASLSKAYRDPYNLKLVQSLEQQVKTLEGKLTAAQEKNIYMASANERLESLLVKTENDNVNLKHVHEQLKYILEKAEDNDVPMKQVHEQLRNVLGKAESDDAHLKRYSQASHSPELGIKEESPWEAADNCGDNFALQNDEIKQEEMFEEHPERSHWKETSASDDSTAISKDVTSNMSMKDKLSGERCQMKAQHDCLDHGQPIYIDNAEVPCEQFSNEDEIQTITAEGKVDHPNVYSEKEATSLYSQLCYANSYTSHTENGTHQ